MAKELFFFIICLLSANYNNDAPEFFQYIADYYFDNILYLKEMQEFRVNKLIENLTKEEYTIFVGENFILKEASKKEKRNMKPIWKFSRSMYSGGWKWNRESFEAEKGETSTTISISEEFKPYILKEGNINKSEVEFVGKAKDTNVYKFYRTSKDIWEYIYLNVEYLFFKKKGSDFDIKTINGKKIKFKIVGMDTGLFSVAYNKDIKIFAILDSVEEN